MRSRWPFSSRKSYTLIVTHDHLSYGDNVVPFSAIEWAACPPGAKPGVNISKGNDAQCVLIKAEKKHGLNFATAEERNLVCARLSRWNTKQASCHLYHPTVLPSDNPSMPQSHHPTILPSMYGRTLA